MFEAARAGGRACASVCRKMGAMATKLDEIVANTRREVAARKAAADFVALERRAAGRVPRGFAAGLRAGASGGGVAVIAELKKASPSKGLIRAEFDVVGLAREMEAAGAAALSVLTDETYFQGSLRNLERASAAVGVPCLRKDFMVDAFQMLEARAFGGDAVLLIVGALTDVELTGLREAARAMELDVLCEVHDALELERAVGLGCECVGVNVRDLRTFEVRLEVAEELVGGLPAGVVKVAESGIRTAADVARLRGVGYEAFLVGESLMRMERPGDGLRALMGVSA